MDIEVGGQIQGISLGSFLQIVHMDKTSCTLKIYSNDEIGYLYLKDGDLVAAETGKLNNVEAAYEILSWNKSVIIIDNAPIPDQKITAPLMTILMEGLRRKDEKNAMLGIKDVEQSEIDVEFDPETYVSRDEQIASQFVVGDSSPSLEEETFSPDSFVMESAVAPPPVAPPPPPPQEPPAVVKEIKQELRKELEQKEPEPPEEKEVEHVRFEDEEVAKETRSFGSVFMRSVIIAVVLGVATYGGLLGYKYYISKENYQRVINQIQSQKKLENMKRLLENYVNHQDDDNMYMSDAVSKLNDVNLLIDVEREVAMLSLDDDYANKASQMYRDYLGEREKSFLEDYVKVQMADIPKIIESYEYKKLLTLSDKDKKTKMKALKSFLKKYPGSQNKQAVQNMLAAIGDESYTALAKELEVCNRGKRWDRCIELTNEFISDFPDDTRLPEIMDLKMKMNNKLDLEDLKAKTAKMSFVDAKKLYIDYLQEHPDSMMKMDIRDEITILNRKIGFQDKWDETYTYCMDPKIPISKRIAELTDFMDRDSLDLFHAQSSALMKDLREEERVGQARMAQLLKERQEKDRQAKIQAEKDRIAREREEARLAEIKRRERERRLAEESERLTKVLEASGGRFKPHSDRTVTDTRSGLIWTMIDSKVSEGECMSYDNAKDYVKALDIGGYRDWRMPDSGELAILYNSEPYYPSSGATWYWTLTAQERTWGQATQKAAVFFPDKKDEFKQVLKDQNECGYVHAVRP